MKEKIKTQKGFIRIPILITIIIGVAMISGGGYFGYTKFKDYQVQKSEKEKLAQEIEWLWQEKEKQQKDEQENKDTELEKLKKEIEAIKNQQIVESKEKLSSQTIKITSDELQQYSSGIGIIYCYGDNFTQGSGSLWHINNLSGLFVLTNRHVITTSNCHIFFEDPRYVGVSIGRYKLDTVNIQAWNNKTDIALLKILYPSLDTSEPLSFLSPKLSNLSFCNQQMPIGSPVAVVGYPAFAQKVWEEGGTQAFQAITEGTISAYDPTVQYSPTSLPEVDYFVSAKIDKGNSGGIVFSKDINGLCILGIPTWISLGIYETQGLVQNIHNVMYIK